MAISVEGRYLKASSLLTCMEDSLFTATKFDVIFRPDSREVTFDVSAISNINANTAAYIQVIAYGIKILERNFTLCSYEGFPCPLTNGHIDVESKYTIGKGVTDQIPGVAYAIPDLDARVRVVLYDDDNPGDNLACVEATLSNGRTVQTKYASWPIAAIAGLGVITSSVVSIIGHSNTAAHIASNSMSLFVYFQSLAITSMMAVAKVPPIAAAWAQNFQWSVGIIRVGFVQSIANWYIQSTGGSSTDILSTLYLSISVQKKKLIKRAAMDAIGGLYKRLSLSSPLVKRLSLDSDDFGYSDTLDSSLYSTNEKADDLASKILILRGIQRVAYLAGIEVTDLFLTSIIFLLFFVFVLIVAISTFKGLIEIAIRSKMMREGRFNEYRHQWSHIVKGSLYRLLQIALPSLSVMCLWEFTRNDSAGAVVVAAFLFAVVIVLLFQAGFRVFFLGRRSTRQFKNPAYLLYGDNKFLNKFGFIYIQYRAASYYWVVVYLTYVFLKSLFVAVLQNHGRAQSVIVFAIELFYMIGLCIVRPFMDKRTNAFNIAISVVSTINALFFMFFSYIFGQPHVVASVMAIIYFVLNAAFALILLVFLIVTCVLALVYKNPDTRYQPMKDDRVSFLPRFDGKGTDGKIRNDDDMELIELGAAAMQGHENLNKSPLEDESVYDDSYSEQTGKKQENPVNGSRDSYYFESLEPAEPTSTIVGDPQDVHRRFMAKHNNHQNREEGNSVSFI